MHLLTTHHSPLNAHLSLPEDPRPGMIDNSSSSVYDLQSVIPVKLLQCYVIQIEAIKRPVISENPGFIKMLIGGFKYPFFLSIFLIFRSVLLSDHPHGTL